jgi:enoyl-CoA hydratase/carnithine racemase
MDEGAVEWDGDVVGHRVSGDCALVRIENPPSNLLSVKVRSGLMTALHNIEGNDDIRAVIIHCGGRSFVSGVDIDEIRAGEQLPSCRSIFGAIEQFPKPVLAVAHGVALGGGLEMMLACHYRCATRETALGLPEVSLGVIPGGGGTQRLPRLVGAARALEMILRARPICAELALKYGLLDHMITDRSPLGVALEYARRLAGRGPRRTSEMAVCLAGLTDDYIRRMCARAGCGPGRRELLDYVVAAVCAASSLPMELGLNLEAELACRAVSSLRDRQSSAFP